MHVVRWEFRPFCIIFLSRHWFRYSMWRVYLSLFSLFVNISQLIIYCHFYIRMIYYISWFTVKSRWNLYRSFDTKVWCKWWGTGRRYYHLLIEYCFRWFFFFFNVFIVLLHCVIPVVLLDISAIHFSNSHIKWTERQKK